MSSTGDTPLHVMVRYGRLDCMMALLAKGASAEIVSAQGTNALHMAIEVNIISS